MRWCVGGWGGGVWGVGEVVCEGVCEVVCEGNV